MFQLFNTRQLIAECEASALLPIYMGGKAHLLLPKSKEQMQMVSAASAESGSGASRSQTSVAVIPVIGVITRYGDACSLGTEEIGAMIERANADPNVTAIVLKINSPGGNADGVAELGDVIFNSVKPVVAHVAMAGSGAAWIATQCREIVLENPNTSRIGSMSAFIIYENVEKQLEQDGVSLEIIRADGSAQKLKPNPFEPLTDAERTAIQAKATQLKSVFQAAVLAGRGERFKAQDSYFDGQMFDAKTAIKIGLADKMGGLAVATTRAVSLARVSKSANQTQIQIHMNTFLTSVGQLLGFSAETQLSETDATAKLTTFVESQTAQIATHVATIEELNTAATTAAAKIASLEARVATQETEIQTLETQLSNVPKPAAPQTDALLSIETHKAKMEALPATHPDRIAFEAWTQAQG